MKVTFVEEIEAHRAWLGNMYCPTCIYGKYNIHHQLNPETDNCWWIECPECGHMGVPQSTKQLAIMEWQKENEV